MKHVMYIFSWFLMAPLLVVPCFSMENKQEEKKEVLKNRGYGYGPMGYWGDGGFGKNGRTMKTANGERLDEVLMLLDALGKVREAKLTLAEELEKNKGNEQKKKMLENYEQQLENVLTECFADVERKDDNYGRAIAAGLAGKDWEVLRGHRIGSVLEGAKLGGLMRVSRATGDVLSKRIEGSIDRVLGGTLDAFIGGIMRAWNGVCEFLFHGGAEPFAEDRLSGWHKLVSTSLTDLERQLKDGLKESMRGHDMTLRQVEKTEENSDEKQEALNAWRMLISGYVRQFMFVAGKIEASAGYYDEADLIVFYATEIVQRLQELANVLDQTKSLKELDALIDANKSFFPAMHKNITNLFARLNEHVQARSYSAQKQSSRSIGSDDSDSRSRSERSSMSGFMMSDDYPRSVR